MKNRYAGTCHACGKAVEADAGELEFIFSSRYHHGRKGRYQLWCMDCYNRSDNSGPEDRCCGNRAYEDACARACGY